MSRVSNVILSMTISEDVEARIADVNALMARLGHTERFALPRCEHWHNAGERNKGWEATTCFSAINYFWTGNFLLGLRAIGWAYPSLVQVLIQGQEDSYFSVCYGRGTNCGHDHVVESHVWKPEDGR